MTEINRALISVSDKKGVVELGRELQRLGWQIISTGGTARTLREAGITVTAVEEVTGYPEILDGRVKTLHPRIHGAILGRTDLEAHRRQMELQGIMPVDLVVVNLYPFAQTISRPGATLEEAIENIDIGGPAMIRAAAKNHSRVAVVVNPERYPQLIAEIKANGCVSAETRFQLAVEAFAHTAHYDALIAAYLTGLPGWQGGIFPPTLTLPLTKVQDLRYGENPQQQAAFYASTFPRQGLAAAELLQGKELSYNNLNDLNAAWELVSEFSEPAAVAVKHTNPCGVGTASTLAEAYRLAYDADPVSIFGGILAFNRPVDQETATEMVKIFLEVVAAPDFTPEALAILQRKKDLRLLKLDLLSRTSDPLELKKVSGGVLVQTVDREPPDESRFEVVTKRKPTEQELSRLAFAWKIVKHVKSNAIVVAGDRQTLGVGAGQMSRIAAARIALAQAGERARGAVLSSDAFFPFADTVEEAAAAGITAIIQPGGSLKDEDSIAACDRHGLAMVFTGRRYFKH